MEDLPGKHSISMHTPGAHEGYITLIILFVKFKPAINAPLCCFTIFIYRNWLQILIDVLSGWVYPDDLAASAVIRQRFGIEITQYAYCQRPLNLCLTKIFLGPLICGAE